MTQASRSRGRAALVLALLAAVTGISAYAFSAASASADGRPLAGAFCTTPAGSMFCMALTWDGVVYSQALSPDRDLQIRPGTYWLTVNDENAMHDFVLRSCPGSTLPCTSTNPAATTPTGITTVAGTPGDVTDKLHLSSGTYRLYCDVVSSRGSHENSGMYVDFEVGGVGQLG